MELDGNKPRPEGSKETSDLPTDLKMGERWGALVTKGIPLGDTLSLTCEASVGESGSKNN